MSVAQQAARVTDPVTHGLGVVGIIGGMVVGAIAGAILIAALPVTAPALVVGLTVAAAAGAVAGGGLAGHQLLAGIQRACALPSPPTGFVGIVGSPNVRIGKLPAARVVADSVTPCHGLYSLYHIPIPPMPPSPIAEGAKTIRINNLLAARVTSRTVCGASVQEGSLTVYYGGPTQQVLAVFDLESMLLSVLGFVAKASLIAMAVLAIPLGVGAIATIAAVFGGFMAVNYGLGVVGDHLPPGWRDILQGGFGVAAIVGGAKALARAGEVAVPSVQEPVVEARGTVNGKVFEDVNQTARPSSEANPNKPTLISDRIAAKVAKSGKALPNGNMATAHAEIGVIQQAYDSGVTQGAHITMVVEGQEVCGYCIGDIPAMATKAGLESVTIVQEAGNRVQLFWQRGMSSLQEKE